jgi:hypothetical protein
MKKIFLDGENKIYYQHHFRSDALINFFRGTGVEQGRKRPCQSLDPDF